MQTVVPVRQRSGETTTSCVSPVVYSWWRHQCAPGSFILSCFPWGINLSEAFVPPAACCWSLVLFSVVTPGSVSRTWAWRPERRRRAPCLRLSSGRRNGGGNCCSTRRTEWTESSDSLKPSRITAVGSQRKPETCRWLFSFIIFKTFWTIKWIGDKTSYLNCPHLNS